MSDVPITPSDSPAATPRPRPVETEAEKAASIKRLFMAWFIAALAILFVACIVAYLVTWSQQDIWPPRLVLPDGSATVPNLPIATLIIGTAAIIVSSFTMLLASVAARRNKVAATGRYLAWTLGLGIGFLALQSFNWWDVYQLLGALNAEATQGYKLFLFLFYTFTAVHALHVIGGIIPLAQSTIAALRNRWNPETSPSGVQLIGWYWHFLDIVWIVLFLIIVLTWFIPLWFAPAEPTMPLEVIR